MKFAIIGLGFIAPRHIAAIEQTRGKILTVCDSDPDKIETARSILRTDVQMFEKFREMIKSRAFKEVDWVVINTPSHLHYEMCIACLRAGKNVLCEKPLVIGVEDAEKLTKAAARYRRKVFTILQLRHHPILREIKKAVYRDRPRDVKLVVRVKRDKKYFNGWKGNTKESGGMLYNLGIHYFDLLLQVFGPEYEVITKSLVNGVATGIINFREGSSVEYEIVALPQDSKDEQDRYIQIRNNKYRLSDNDNVSYEGLHRIVYERLHNNEGVEPRDAIKVNKLIEKLK